MTSVFLAGAAYAGTVFAIGLVLGTLRVLALQPLLGELAAVLMELPLILAASWVLCGWLMRRFIVPHRFSTRVALGAVALAVLLGLEWTLASSAFGRSAVEILAGYRSLPGALGLLAQLGFAALPAVRLFVSPAVRA